MKWLFGPLQEETGKKLAWGMTIPLTVVMALLGWNLLTGPMWDYLVSPLLNGICTNVSEEVFGGNLNVCTWGSRGQQLLADLVGAVIGGQGGDTTQPPQDAFRNINQHEELLDIVALTELQQGVVVDVIGNPDIFSLPNQLMSQKVGVWDTNSNPQAIVWATLQLNNGGKWIRLTEVGHPTPLYMNQNAVISNQLPTAQLFMQDPYGSMPENVGPKLRDGTYAVNAWKQLRDEGGYEVNQYTLEVLETLSSTGQNWRLLTNAVNVAVERTDNAKNQLSSMNMWENAEGVKVAEILKMLTAVNTQMKVTEVEYQLFSDGTELVTLQPVTTINNVEHPVGTAFQIPIGLLRPAVGNIRVGEILKGKRD